MPPDLTALRILFVTAASNAIGFGHLARCLSLANYAQERHADIHFLVFGSKEAVERVSAAGYRCSRLDQSDINGSAWAETDGLKSDVVLVDLLFPTFASDCRDPEELFRQLHGLGRCLVALDVLGDSAIASRWPRIDADILVVPYVAPPRLIGSAWHLLEGAAYALLAPEYSGLPPRHQRQSANRVLVSCGGSDPKGYTPEILQCLATVSQPLEIVAVIGPLFGSALRDKVAAVASKSRHLVTLVDAPRTLLDEMLWCDMAICASGLTKYELAASGTPALLFSIDELHDTAHRTFAATGTAIDLGIGIAAAGVVRETERLLNDVGLRDMLAMAGQRLVDGKGNERLFTEIKKELSC